MPDHLGQNTGRDAQRERATEVGGGSPGVSKPALPARAEHLSQSETTGSKDESMSEHTEAVKAAAEYLAEWMPRCSHENPRDMLWLADHVVAVADNFGGGMTKEQLREQTLFLNRIIADLRDAIRVHEDAIKAAGTVRVRERDEAAAIAKHQADQRLWDALDG